MTTTLRDRLKEDNIYSTQQQLDVKANLAELFDAHDEISTAEKLAAFPKYITRQDMSLFLARYEIFKQILDVKGSIIECGVYYGSGLMTYAQLSAALEPINYNRRIIGFDTFSGNSGWSERDHRSRNTSHPNQANYAIDTEGELNEITRIYDANRFLNHIPKIELVRGDIVTTLPEYLQSNPHLLVSLLSLTINLYEPTKVALATMLPRMGKGAIVAIHTLNEGVFPGATLALLDELSIRDYKVLSFASCPNLSYVVL